MSAVADTVSTRVHIADPKPAYCSACGAGAREELRFVDFDAAHDSGVVVNEFGGVLIGQDDLYLCEDCVRSGAEALGFKPQLHSTQVRTIKSLERARDHYKDENARLRAIIGKGGSDGS